MSDCRASSDDKIEIAGAMALFLDDVIRSFDSNAFDAVDGGSLFSVIVIVGFRNEQT
jgi:hypothetical protein